MKLLICAASLLLLSSGLSVSAEESKDSVCTPLGIHHDKHNSNLDQLFHPASLESRMAEKLVFKKKQRVQIACDMKQVILEKYSLIHLKKERIGVDAEGHLEQCAVAELKAKDGNLEFMDRMQKCIAGFKDTHFGLRFQIPKPWTYSGFRLIKDPSGKFIISTITPQILSYVAERSQFEDLLKIVSLGNEVIKIEGQDPQIVVDQLAEYVDASTDGFRQERATIHLTARSFNYPKSAYLTLTVKWVDKSDKKNPKEKISKIQVPWWASTSASRVDATAHFEKIGIESSNWVRWSYNEKENKWTSVSTFPREGLDLKKALFEGPNILQYFAEDGTTPVLRVGEVIKSQNQVFCYMQLLSFSHAKLKEKPDAESIEIVKIAQGFVGQCKSKKLPLIFDLRSNPGGIGGLPSQFMQMLMRSDSTNSIGRFLTFRNSTDVGWLLAGMMEPDDIMARELSDFTDWRYFFDSYDSASESNSKHLSIINSKLSMNETIQGYDEKIVALITPNCISACDIMSNLLKSSGRATLVGTHSNGTGAGFLSYENYDSRWKDSYNLFKLRIPNSLFGVIPQDVEEGVLDFETYKKYVSENQPTEADVIYKTSLEDIMKKAAGWSKIALDTMFGAEEVEVEDKN